MNSPLIVLRFGLNGSESPRVYVARVPVAGDLVRYERCLFVVEQVELVVPPINVDAFVDLVART